MSERFQALLVAAALFVSLPLAGEAQQGQRHAAPAGKPGAPGQLTMSCQEMTQAHQKVMTEAKAMDARLDELVQKMNEATGQAKLEATAAAVTELVRQRKAMRDTMQTMQMRMMQHMGEHLRAGGADALMQCPMMQMKPMK